MGEPVYQDIQPRYQKVRFTQLSCAIAAIDLRLGRLVPFLLIVLIIEEIIPLIVMYVPGILPSTCILPSQLERIQTKAENTRKGALKSVSSLLKDVKMEDLKSLVAGGLKSFDGALLKELCR